MNHAAGERQRRGFTFRVHDVVPAGKPLEPEPFALIHDKPLVLRAGTILAKSFRDDARIISVGKLHPLAAAAQLAYSHHYPLALSPDTIWITILQGLAWHIRFYAEELRHLLVAHEGKRTLRVLVGDLPTGDRADEWNDIIHKFAYQIGAASEGIAEWAVCDFSTTGTL